MTSLFTIFDRFKSLGFFFKKENLVIVMFKPKYELLKNVHEGASRPFTEPKTLLTIKGSFEYWHYGCDGFDDRGFGCGYRTLQSICSWMNM